MIVIEKDGAARDGLEFYITGHRQPLYRVFNVQLTRRGRTHKQHSESAHPDTTLCGLTITESAHASPHLVTCTTCQQLLSEMARNPH